MTRARNRTRALALALAGVEGGVRSAGLLPGASAPLGFLLGIALLSSTAAEVDESKLPPPATRSIDYERDVRPVFEAACFRCHGPERPRSGFRLDNREAALKGGSNGVDIHPGQSAKSPLIHFVARLVDDMEMPPPGKGDPLTPEQIGVLRAWIDQGAPYPEAAAGAPRFSQMTVTPALRAITVRGNEAVFREHWWVPDGVSGGIERFEWQETLPQGQRFSVEGRGLLGAHDYQLKLSYEQPQLGFIRGGYEQFAKWYSDTGGAYAPFGVPALSLDRDLRLDNGRAWIEAGLTRPGVPQMTVGYEYRFREGEKSTLQWGVVQDPATGGFKAIYPAFKEVNEDVHVVKFDISHPVLGGLVADSFRGEFYDLKTQRQNVDAYRLGSPQVDALTQLREGHDHFQGANTLHFEKPVRDWLFLSAGYLYSHLDGDASFDLTTFIPADPSQLPFAGDASQEIVLRRRAHVLNGNAQIGPWQGLTFVAGLQGDWTRQEGFGNAVIGGFPSPYSADLDKVTVEGDFVLRFTRLPCTVVYTEARLQREQVGQYETAQVDDLTADSRDFLRDTDATADLGDFRIGATVSPWQRLALDVSARHVSRATDYAHLRDEDQSALPGNGYPAFINARDSETQEVGAKLTLHWRRWLKTALKYQVVATDMETTTAAGVDVGTGTPFVGGRLLSGNYDAHVISLGTTMTPWRRFYLTADFSYSDSRTLSGVNDGTTVVPYAGDVFTVLSSATYVLDAQTDLRVSYAFSRADFAQDNILEGLPLGIVYDRHGLTAGLTRRFKQHTTVSLQYGFFDYREPTAAGANDYTAHGVFASLTRRLR